MPTNIRPGADSFERIVANIERNMHGPRPMMTTFLAGSAPLWLHVNGLGVATLSLVTPDAEEVSQEVVLCAVTLQPSAAWGKLAVLHDAGSGVELGDFRTWRSAIGAALECVCAANWYAGAQDQHDTFAI